MRITSLRQTSSEHVTAVLDDGQELRTTLGVVTEMRLFVGRELDEHELDGLRRASSCALTREKALELLGRRQMSARELGRKLRDRGADEETADSCVRWVAEHGFLDEEGYAAAIVRHYAAKGCGEGRVRQELMRRGVPRELWEDALSQMPENTEALDRLISARLKDPDDRDAVRRLSASLYRRGYSGEDIRAALERVRAAYEFED